MGGSKTYPYGSTSTTRGYALAALGVLKVASADQIWRLMCPGHRDNKTIRNALLDLARHGLVHSEGSAATGHKLWGLTPLGLAAAAEELGRPIGEMGGTARGAARSGAKYALAVNETIIAFTRTAPEPTRPVVPPARITAVDASTAPQASTPERSASSAPAGIGTIRSWATEVVHHLPAAGRNKSGAQADAVLQAPEAGLPVCIVEVDNGTESAEVLAAKLEKYHRFFRLTAKTPHGEELPVWRTLYGDTGREGYPPIALVFNGNGRLGSQAIENRIRKVLELSRPYWAGMYHEFGGYRQGETDGYVDYTDTITVLACTLESLQREGPRGAIWQRFGHRQPEPLPDALHNPRDKEAFFRRDEERRQRRQAEEQEQREHAEQERQRQARETPRALARQKLAQLPRPAPCCVRCGTSIDPAAQPELNPFGFREPDDGWHCALCRAEIESPPPLTLRKVLKESFKEGLFRRRD